MSGGAPENDHDINHDIIICGGGLAGGLIALALAARRPELDVAVIEGGAAVGGHHIWSFFDSDIAPDHRWLIEPLIGWTWAGYDVAFPALRRTLRATYNSIPSERLADAVRATLPADRIIMAPIVDAAKGRVTLADQRVLTAGLVIDARGAGDLSTLDKGWQKFVGRALTVPGGHGLTRPIVMDATVDQIDGYRFVYCLPFDATTVFVEDTYYSDTPELDVDAVRARIDAYAAARGWGVTGFSREEVGCIPVVTGGDFYAYWNSTGPDLAKAGVRGGLFHATTGYSLPSAVRAAAAFIEGIGRPDPAADARAGAAANWRGQRFYRLLDTMLFDAAEPQERYRIMQRFYGLPEPLIERFYAGASTMADKLRIVSGKPPVPIGRAVAALKGFSWI